MAIIRRPANTLSETLEPKENSRWRPQLRHPGSIAADHPQQASARGWNRPGVKIALTLKVIGLALKGEG